MNEQIRLLICGDRLWNDYELIKSYVLKYKPSVLIEGGARGADTLAHQAARHYRVQIITYPADWKTYGKRAGPIRNQQMLKEGRPTIVIGFHDNLELSKGTKHMLGISMKAGIKTIHVSSKKETVLHEGE